MPVNRNQSAGRKERGKIKRIDYRRKAKQGSNSIFTFFQLTALTVEQKMAAIDTDCTTERAIETAETLHFSLIYTHCMGTTPWAVDAALQQGS